ncbi:PTPLA-domain-containing protein [Punctularia strigosozonata HHB-11173 SS5]|uniref:PTPLA-domain-containing protein n=1 Tax=Punctularia strigosozonata (strain HHB-11173) TaxID=741275 RepID=UPI0004416FB4|nr:PTPLA-domain-containing protein [Punctularia strigosozonata HHB-11173 SS5]EIN11632.1 PTPLA-domain-containing protein [Punctularia strigosozonata HHB-11173 SS5]
MARHHEPVNAKRRGPTTGVKYYLVTYNVLSALGWSYVLIVTLIHVFRLDTPQSTTSNAAEQAKSALQRLLELILSYIPFLPKPRTVVIKEHLRTRLPVALWPYIDRAASAFWRVGKQTAFVQSFAALEVVHVLLGWVRSPLVTTAIQVASRLWLVWGICDQYESARTSPLYATMVFAWSVTEVIRYSFYAFNLTGKEPYPLVWLRYTTFYILYPLGAGSEAFVMFSTLPSSSPLPSEQTAFSQKWDWTDYGRGALFLVWWPGLYVMYTYMIKQRRKVIGGGGQKLRPKSKSE